jgi:hypothetical protein
MPDMTAREAIGRIEYLLLAAKQEESTRPKPTSTAEIIAEKVRLHDIEVFKVALAALSAQIPKPNMPLTKEQIMGMDKDDAVWCADREGALDVLDGQDASAYFSAWPNDLYFEVKPSPADIEAARKEQTE